MYKAVIKYCIANKVDYVNIVANRMEYTNSHLYVFNNDELVGVFLTEMVIDAHISVMEK